MLAGIDLGASSLKITLCDYSGAIVATVQESVASCYPHYPQSDHVEQNPADWLGALQKALGRPEICRAAITDMAVSAGAHICVLLDAYGKVLRPAIMWNDQRAAQLASELAASFGERIAAITNNRVQATWSLATLAWLHRYQPEVLQKVTRICFAKDYLRMWLCGSLNKNTDWVTDPGDAAGALLADTPCWSWHEELCQLAGIDVAALPTVVPATHKVGEIDKAVAAQTGLASGINIYTGSIDTSTELLATGCIQPDDCLLKLATAGVWSRVIEEPAAHTSASLYPGVVENWYHASGVNNCAAALAWGANLLWGTENSNNPDNEDGVNTKGGRTTNMLDEALGRILWGFWGCSAEQPGTQPTGQPVNLPEPTALPLFHPYLMGERAPLWNAQLRAGFSLVSQQHERDALAWAIAEGILFGLRHARDVSALSQPKENIVVAGGLTHLPNMLQLCASVLNQPLYPCHNPDASYGTALLAGIAAKKLHVAEVRKLVCTNNRKTPVEPLAGFGNWIDQRYQLYREQIKYVLQTNARER